jgi:hypothetical protein
MMATYEELKEVGDYLRLHYHHVPEYSGSGMSEDQVVELFKKHGIRTKEGIQFVIDYSGITVGYRTALKSRLYDRLISKRKLKRVV